MWRGACLGKLGVKTTGGGRLGTGVGVVTGVGVGRGNTSQTPQPQDLRLMSTLTPVDKPLRPTTTIKTPSPTKWTFRTRMAILTLHHS